MATNSGRCKKSMELIHTLTDMKPKTWSRKGRCPGCGVGTASKHSRDCQFDYLPKAMQNKIAIDADLLTNIIYADRLLQDIQAIEHSRIQEAMKAGQIYPAIPMQKATTARKYLDAILTYDMDMTAQVLDKIRGV